LRQTLAGLLCAAALYLLAWNEVAAARGGSLLAILPFAADGLDPDGAARNGIRAVAALLAVSGSFFCLAGMGNTLGLISLFGGRIALSARLTGAVLGILLALAAAALGHYAGDPASATLLVTPLASVLLLLLWQSRRERPPTAMRASNAAAPILLDLPERSAAPQRMTQAPATAPAPSTPPAPGIRPPAVFTARAPRSDQGNPELAPLDFASDGNRGRIEPGFTTELGLPPLEFTPRAAASAPTATRVPPPRTTPRQTNPGLPPLDFPSQTPAPAAPPATRVSPTPPLTLDTLDFSSAPAPVTAPLADELARWSPRPATAPSTIANTPTAIPRNPATITRATVAPAPIPPPVTPKADPVRPPLDLDDAAPVAMQSFTLDTVTPREQGPRRALLDEEPDLLNQLGSLAQVQTPPSAPLTPLLSQAMSASPQTTSEAPPPIEPERIKLADKGVFSIYKLIESGRIVAYALTEHGVTVMVGTQEQVKQNLRERWPGRS
jgi:hypothetical protein